MLAEYMYLTLKLFLIEYQGEHEFPLGLPLYLSAD